MTNPRLNTVANRDLPYLVEDEDRHNNVRIYVRVRGKKIRIRERRGTLAFHRAYTDAVERLKTPPELQAPRVQSAITRFSGGTLGWLGAQYFASEEFKKLDATSQKNRRGVLEACFAEPLSDENPKPMGLCPLEYVTPQKIKRLRDLKAGLPGAANNRKKYLSAMFGWAIETTPPLWPQANPARDVRRVEYATDGFHTWTVEEVEQFEERHPIGTKARLALALLLYLGVRRSDVVMLSRQSIKNGWITFIPQKTRYKRVRNSHKPVLPALAAIIAESPCSEVTFLETEYGKPFTAEGFGNWFRDRCNEAGLPQCTAHGLRKAGATRAAENGATVNQLMAIFDWDTPAQAKVYTDAADRKRLTGEAMHMLAERNKNGNCPTD